MRITRLGLLISAGYLSVPAVASERSNLNLTPGVTEISNTVYDLHMLILGICTLIGIGVFGTMFYSIIKHRKSAGHEAATFHESTTVEIVWTLIPILILIGMAIPATKTLIAMEQTGDSDMTIKITGYQWKWEYEYLDEGIRFFSNLSTPRDEIENQQSKNENYLLEVDNPVVVPINTKVRFLLTANDVIHSWWVPDLAVKKDAIPGFINEMWTVIDKPGTYRGQCTELCGKDHGFMPVVLIAMEEDDYRKWVAGQKTSAAAEEAMSGQTFELAELISRGEEVYNRNCASCHQANGVGLPGVFPAIKDSPVAKGDKSQHLTIVMKGRKGTAMQAFEGQLSDVDIAAVVTYQRNAWGNDMGDSLQPAEVAGQR